MTTKTPVSPTQHLDILIQRYPALDSCRDSISQAFTILQNAYKNDKKLLIAGNGGSAADADHISGELLKGFQKKRPLPQSFKSELSNEVFEALQGSLPAIPLSSFNSLSTAFANDCNSDFTFAQLTLGLGNSGDVLLAISTSGNSANILHAVEVAKAKNIPVIALTGKTGGKLAQVADVAICAPATEVYQIQEFHLPIYHTLSSMLEEYFFPDES